MMITVEESIRNLMCILVHGDSPALCEVVCYCRNDTGLEHQELGSPACLRLTDELCEVTKRDDVKHMPSRIACITIVKARCWE